MQIHQKDKIYSLHYFTIIQKYYNHLLSKINNKQYRINLQFYLIMNQQKQYLHSPQVKTGRSNKKVTTINSESRLTYLLTSRRAAATKYIKGFRNTQNNIPQDFSLYKKNSISGVKNSLTTLDRCLEINQKPKKSILNVKMDYCTINPEIITARKAFIDKHLKTQAQEEYFFPKSPLLQCIATRKYKNSKPLNSFRLKAAKMSSSRKNSFVQKSPYQTIVNGQNPKRMKSEPAINSSSILDKRQKLGLRGYEYIKQLGTGGYARVVLAKRMEPNNFGYFAIKIYDKIKTQQKSKVTNIPREVKIMSQIMHPNICRIAQQYESRSTHFIIMQYCGCQSLYRKIGQSQLGYLKQRQARKYFRKILEAFIYLHEKRIAHRDVKAENILVHKGDIKLIDFGFSVALNSTDLVDSYCGTPAYMAPEIFDRTPYNPFSAQTWSLGILLYLMVQGIYPFLSSSEEGLVLKIKKGNYRIVKPISRQAQDLLSCMLQVDACSRIDLKSVGKHRWFEEQSQL